MILDICSLSTTYSRPVPDIVLRQPPGAQPCFLSDDRVFIDIFAGEDATIMNDKSRPPTLKIRRLGPLVTLPDSAVWKVEGSFELCVSCHLRFESFRAAQVQ